MAPPRSSDLTIALVLLLFGALGVDARAARLVGHVYMQTNETQNHIMHFGRNAGGQLELLESVPTSLAEGVAGAGGGAMRLLPVRPDHVGGGAAEEHAEAEG